MELIILFLPLFTSLIIGLNLYCLGPHGAFRCSKFSMFILWFCSFHLLLNSLLKTEIVYIDLFNWITAGHYVVSWSFQFDHLAIMMLFVIITISLLVHLYSYNYLAGDPRLNLFLSYLSLFTFFMIFLVTGSNLLVTIVGWEGVGLCSYLLVSFWSTRIQALKSALKAILMNRIGDFSFLLAIVYVFQHYGTIDYSVLSFLVHNSTGSFSHSFFGYTVTHYDVICLLLFGGAVGKSAQLGLHTWLPDAMEGPTPVSALIHAATMVTAGVFLIIRTSFFFECSSSVRLLVSVIAALTIFFAGTVALFQHDIKKIIAYSTCSQLGYMILSCGLSNYVLGFFHLFNHAFFKALLFLCAGNLIHGFSDDQDIRKMGMAARVFPATYVAICIGSAALAGFYFLSGFYSKEFIIFLVFKKSSFVYLYLYFLTLIGVYLTLLYSWKIILYVFKTFPAPQPIILQRERHCVNTTFKSYANALEEGDGYMIGVIAILSVLSITSGFFFFDIFLGVGSSFFDDSIFNNYYNDSIFSLELLNINLFISTPFCFFIFSSVLAFYLFIGPWPYFFYFPFTTKYFSFGYKDIFLFFNKKWYFDKLYNDLIAKKILSFSYSSIFIGLDKGFLEFFGPTGSKLFLKTFDRKLHQLQTGSVNDYIFFSCAGVLLMLSIFILYG